MRKKINLNPEQIQKLAAMADSRSQTQRTDDELRLLEESLAAKITETLKRTPDNVTGKNDEENSGNEINIESNWAAIKKRIDAAEKPAAKGGSQEPAQVRSLAEARAKQQQVVAEGTPAVKKSKFFPAAITTLLAVAAAVVLYVMPQSQTPTDTDPFSIKGVSGAKTAVCTFELRSKDNSYTLGDEPVVIAGSEPVALVTRCPETQILQLQISTKGQAPTRILNTKINDATGQMIFPAAGSADLLSVNTGDELTISILSTSETVSGDAINFDEPGKEVNWSLNFVVGAE